MLGDIKLRKGDRPSVAQILDDQPQFRATSTPATTTGDTNNSASTADLRGLGPVRTLTLLNGHRFTGANDLNTIPVPIIKRVDVVTGGASAAWGSGAVAGVVNIILDDAFGGVLLGVDTGVPSPGDDARRMGIPGAGYVLIDHGRIVCEGGAGVRTPGRPEPVDAHTLIMIASNTKGMSTLLLAKLVDEGRLRWDQRVTELYPAFRLGSDEATSRVLVRHLVCACTGLPRRDFDRIS